MAHFKRTRHGRALLAAALIPSLGSCAVLLDFDDLQGGETPVIDSGSPGGASGSGGTGAVGASSGAGGVGATAGSGGATGGAPTGGGGGGPLEGGIDASAEGGPPDAEAGPQVPLAELPGALATAICSALDVCVGPLLEIFTGAEDCLTIFTRTLEDGYAASIQTSVDAGETTYDPALAAECVQSLVAATEANPPQCSAFTAIIEDCKSALGRLSGAGGPCRHDYDCGRALRCDVSSACPGQCVALGAAGTPCVTNQDCDSTQNLYCQATQQDGGTVSVCTPYLLNNADCTLGGQACEIGTFCLENKCLPIPDAFTSAQGFDCVTTGTLCRSGLSCELNTGWSCIAELAPLATCRISLPDACPSGYYCSVNFLNGGGQCLALPTENQACASAFMVNIGLAPPCAGGLVCVEGFCKSKQRLDDSCEIDGQCYSGSCSATEAGATGTCEPPMCQ